MFTVIATISVLEMDRISKMHRNIKGLPGIFLLYNKWSMENKAVSHMFDFELSDGNRN